VRGRETATRKAFWQWRQEVANCALLPVMGLICLPRLGLPPVRSPQQGPTGVQGDHFLLQGCMSGQRRMDGADQTLPLRSLMVASDMVVSESPSSNAVPPVSAGVPRPSSPLHRGKQTSATAVPEVCPACQQSPSASSACSAIADATLRFISEHHTAACETHVPYSAFP